MATICALPFLFLNWCGIRIRRIIHQVFDHDGSGDRGVRHAHPVVNELIGVEIDLGESGFDELGIGGNIRGADGTDAVADEIELLVHVEAVAFVVGGGGGEFAVDTEFALCFWEKIFVDEMVEDKELGGGSDSGAEVHGFAGL